MLLDANLSEYDTCDSIQCSDGYILIDRADEVECYEGVCREAQCCEKLCSTHTCKDNYSLVDYAATTVCDDGVCSDDQCCVEDGKRRRNNSVEFSS